MKCWYLYKAGMSLFSSDSCLDTSSPSIGPMAKAGGLTLKDKRIQTNLSKGLIKILDPRASNN